VEIGIDAELDDLGLRPLSAVLSTTRDA